MNVIWYLFVCSSFLGGGYALSKREENKRLKERLRQKEEGANFPRQFVDISA